MLPIVLRYLYFLLYSLVSFGRVESSSGFLERELDEKKVFAFCREIDNKSKFIGLDNKVFSETWNTCKCNVSFKHQSPSRTPIFSDLQMDNNLEYPTVFRAHMQWISCFICCFSHKINSWIECQLCKYPQETKAEECNHSYNTSPLPHSRQGEAWIVLVDNCSRHEYGRILFQMLPFCIAKFKMLASPFG